MTQRDLDEAVARLRAASLRNDPTAADLEPDLGPPRGRPETAGQGPLDPDSVDAHAHVVSGVSSLPAGMDTQPRTDWNQPLPREAVAAPRPAQPPPSSISPEARARAEAQLRAAIQGQRGGQASGGQAAADDVQAPRRAPARPQPAPNAGGHPAARPVPPAPVLDVADRRNHIGDPGTTDFGVATDDGFDEPRSRKSGFFGSGLFKSGPSARRAGAERARPQARAEELATPKQQRWRRRRRRHLFEEILGWILVPVILFGLYWAVVGGLAIFGLSIDDAVVGMQEAWEVLR